MEFIDSSHISTVFAPPSFRFHFIPPFFRFARCSRDRTIGFFTSRLRRPLLLPAPHPRENPVRYEGLKTTNVHITDWFPEKRANHWRGRFDSVRDPFKQRTDQTTPHTNDETGDIR